MKPNSAMLLEKRTLRLLIAFIAILTSLPFSFGQLVEEPQITDLMDRWKAYNEGVEEVRGWRIQIMASVDRRQMESARRTFENRYPDYPVQFIHNEPYYHLKVGAFLTMQKAQAFMKKMQEDYPQAIPVTDNLKVEELLLYDQ
jgi:SPOR domain